MSTGKIELSVGAIKIANKYDIFTEEEVVAINNKIPELDGRVGDIEDEIVEINSSLDNIMQYPILDIEKEQINNISIINKKYPYLHVHSYGAVNDGETDCTNAIQLAVDLSEKLYPLGLGREKLFESGGYVITKTIQCKCKEFHNNTRPLTFRGVGRKNIHNNDILGTTIIPKINNYSGKKYANAFAININFDENDNEIDTIYYGGGVGATICNNITFKDLCFYLSSDDNKKYNINCIKAYRSRFDIDNIYCDGLSTFILQPPTDKNGNTSYCDFSNYTNIHLYNMKDSGLSLYNADSSIIQGITCHMPGENFTHLIMCRSGAGIKISNIVNSYNFIDDTKIPFNRGSGQTGNKAIIKLAGTNGVTIENLYVERQLMDYAIYLYNAINTNLTNYYDRYFSNGFISVNEGCKILNINNIYRDSNIIEEYKDIFFTGGKPIENTTISNFYCNNYYNETLRLDSDYSNMVLTKDVLKPKRSVKVQKFAQQYADKYTLERLDLIVGYNTSTLIWEIKNLNGELINSYFTLTWESNGVILKTLDNSWCKFVAVQPYTNATEVPLYPILRQYGNDVKVMFMNFSNATLSSTLDTRMKFRLTIETLR